LKNKTVDIFRPLQIQTLTFAAPPVTYITSLTGEEWILSTVSTVALSIVLYVDCDVKERVATGDCLGRAELAHLQLSIGRLTFRLENEIGKEGSRQSR